MTEKPFVVTVCNRTPTEYYYCLNEFFKSLKDAGCLMLGRTPGSYNGLASKPKLLYKAIKEGQLPDSIVFTDCWDAVFATHPQELVDIFEKVYAPEFDIVISAEKNCFPDDLKPEFDSLNTPTSYKYLNSGMIVGKTDAILTCLKAMDLSNVPDDHYDEEKRCMVHPNDQFLWQQVFVKQPVKIKLDSEQWMSQTLHGVAKDELNFDFQNIFNKETGASPRHFHFNGSAKTSGLREPILKHLNLL